jgi:hypothetical protein
MGLAYGAKIRHLRPHSILHLIQVLHPDDLLGRPMPVRVANAEKVWSWRIKVNPIGLIRH